MEIFSEYYLWIKMVHYLSFVSWMAGLFYLPRLFVYHSEHKDNQGFVEVVKIQEKKLYLYIQTPAMLMSVITGILMLILNKNLLSFGFMHVKLSLVILLLFYHFHNYFCLKELARDTCKKSGKYFRIYNEIPTLIFIGIAIMMVIRPF